MEIEGESGNETLKQSFFRCQLRAGGSPSEMSGLQILLTRCQKIYVVFGVHGAVLMVHEVSVRSGSEMRW